MPELSASLAPPCILGTADLASFAYRDPDFGRLMDRIHCFHDEAGAEAGDAARLFDAGLGHILGFRRADGLELQDQALEGSVMFRVARGAHARGLRLLAIVAPGDLMTNTPLDFLTNELDIRLDLLFVLAGRDLPRAIPDHDVAFFAVGEAGPAELSRLRRLFAAWPRPALNDPRFLPVLRRDTLASTLRGIPTICSPPVLAASRAGLLAGLAGDALDLPPVHYPSLIRPRNSHAGAGLALVRSGGELAEYLRFSFASEYFLTRFVDYAGPDRLYRKLRVAFIDGRPYLCHMAVSEHWMVHYLNAGMSASAAKRAAEAQAMEAFDTGFARRHARAFEALHRHLGFDFYSIDCAEAPDGRLLLFEADSAAIIHAMDSPELFPYKVAQMRRVFDAFEVMVRRRAGQGGEGGSAGDQPSASVAS